MEGACALLPLTPASPPLPPSQGRSYGRRGDGLVVNPVTAVADVIITILRGLGRERPPEKFAASLDSDFCGLNSLSAVPLEGSLQMCTLSS